MVRTSAIGIGSAALVALLLAGVAASGGAEAAGNSHGSGTAHLSGTVTAPGGGVPDAQVTVNALASGVHNETVSANAATGEFEFVNIPAGDYILTFTYQGTSNFVQIVEWPEGTGASPGLEIPIAAGESVERDFELIAGARVSGQISTSDGAPLSSASVVFQTTDASWGTTASVASDGTFAASQLPADDFRVRFSAAGRTTEYWNDVIAPGDATVLTLEPGLEITDIDPVLEPAANLRGTVMFESSPGELVPYSGVVAVRRTGTEFTFVANTDSLGRYAFDNLQPGSFDVCFGDRYWIFGATSELPNCWGGGATFAEAEPIVLGRGETRDDVDAVVQEGGFLTGTVTYFSPVAGGFEGANGTTVSLYRLNEAEDVFEWYAQEIAGPSFYFHTLPPGTYAVHFFAPSAFENELLLNSEYWQNARYWAQRTDLVIEIGDDVDLGDVVLSPRSIDVARIEGGNRFEVGVNVSQVLYPDEFVPPGGVPIVYVANGYNFPDALTAGPAAALEDGVVLLVEPGSIPTAVAEELTRLRPQRIVVAGGPASVSPEVFQQLTSYVPEPSDVFRAGGADRYQASRTVVRNAFEAGGADMAIISTGANFPDALSAGPAAASQDAPVILVNGSASSIDSETEDLLVDLGISRVYIAGGTKSVSPGIEASLEALLGSSNVVRFAGADRFEVGVLISQEFFGSAEFTFVATGYKFPDALTGGPLAAAYGGPLYLSRPECLPAGVAFDVLDLDAQAIILLGGPASLSPAVENLQLC